MHLSEKTQPDEKLPDLEGKPYLEQVRLAAEYVLSSQDKTSDDNTMTGPEIRKKAQSEFPPNTFEMSDNTFSQYLSKTVSDSKSRINTSEGRKGYFLLSDDAIKALESAIPEDEGNLTETSGQKQCRVHNKREEKLYSIFAGWLNAEGYRSRDISSATKNGAWGNPDVLGVKVYEGFATTVFEIVSIEAKLNFKNWKRDIFEAISHRRFANRSYFAFAHPESLREKIDRDELRYFSDLFRVGIVALILSDKDFESLQNDIKLAEWKPEKFEIVEVLQSPYSSTPPEHQFRFLQNLGIKNNIELARFGDIQS